MPTATALLARWAAQLLLGNPLPWPMNRETPDDGHAIRFFSIEGISALCHHSIETVGLEKLVPAEVWKRLGQEHKAAVAVDLIRGHRDAQVFDWLAEIDLRPLVLKGAAYARTIYAESHLRPRCDTDLLFPDRKSARRAWAALEQKGYQLTQNVVEGRFVSRQRTCVLPGAAGHTLDLHWAISNTHTFARALPLDELMREAVPLLSLHPQARALGPVHSLLFACLHFFGHERAQQWPRLLWLYDIYRLGERLTDSDWRTFNDQAIARGVAGICRHVLDQTNRWFPLNSITTIRPDLLVAEEKEVFRPGRIKNAFWFSIYDLRALDGWNERLQWILETAFPPATYMRSKYAESQNAWLPTLYLRRSAQGVMRRLRHNNQANPHQEE